MLENPNQHNGGLGGVLMLIDEDGMFKAAFAVPVTNVATVKQVELLAIKEGFQLLQKMQVTNSFIEPHCVWRLVYT